MNTRQASADLRAHLVAVGLAGAVATPPSSTLTNCERLLAGRPHYTFGLSDWRRATLADVLAALRTLCGGDPERAELDGPGWIDPDQCLRGVERHRQSLEAAARQGARVLLATGHPTGLIPHYGAIARRLRRAGCKILTPLDDVTLRCDEDGRRQGVRFLDGVAVNFNGAALVHSHHPRSMEAMLDEISGPDGVDLVIGDHGMAGAAIEQGIQTLSIADVNDPALPLAQARGRTDSVLAIDDNLAPSVFVAVTREMLRWS